MKKLVLIFLLSSSLIIASDKSNQDTQYKKEVQNAEQEYEKSMVEAHEGVDKKISGFKDSCWNQKHLLTFDQRAKKNLTNYAFNRAFAILKFLKK